MAKRRKRKSRSGSSDRDEVRRDGRYWFDAAAADRAVEFIEKLCRLWQGKWAGEPFVLLDYQRKAVRDVWGWKRPNGTRRYREVYIEVPKKNGKSPFAAALALLLLFCDGEAGAEVYSLARDRQQASKVTFQDGKMMVEQSPALKRRARIFRRSIEVPETNSCWQVLSADSVYQHGFRPSGVVIDELWLQPDADLYDAMRLGMVSRDQPLLISITHAGHREDENLCWRLHQYALEVIKNPEFDPAFYAVIFAADPNADWTDPAIWHEANPGLGVTIVEEEFARIIRKAQNDPSEQARVKQLHLNIWNNPVIENGIDMAAWAKCGELEQLVTRGAPCWVGLDLSSKGHDLTAAVAVFPHGDEGRTVSMLAHFWIPEGNVEDRKRRDAFDYPRYISEGYITETSGDWIDLGPVREKLREWAATYDVVEIGFDPYNSSQMVKWLQDEDGLPIIEVRQGPFTLSEACKGLLNLVIAGRLRHGNNPVLTWNMQNLEFKKTVSNLWMPKKHKLNRRKIDGAVAAIIGYRQAMVVEAAPAPGVMSLGA